MGSCSVKRQPGAAELQGEGETEKEEKEGKNWRQRNEAYWKKEEVGIAVPIPFLF